MVFPQLPDEFKHIKIPVSWAITALFAIVGGYAYMHSTFVLAGEFKDYKQQTEVRLVSSEKKLLENEVFRLNVKQSAVPEKFDAVDKEMLARYKEQLEETRAELNKIKDRNR